MKKNNSILIIFLFSFFLISSYQIELVNAIGTVFIRSDGSIEGFGLMFSDGVYFFTGNIYGQIVIEKDGVTVDGSGYVLNSMNEGGICLENRSGVVLRNLEVIYAPFGITLGGGRNNEITGSNCTIHLKDTFNNTVYCNKRISMLFSNASKNIVSGNNITGSIVYGFKLQKFSNENSIFGNNVTNNTSGIEFHGESNNNTVYGNNIIYNIEGMMFHSSFNNSIHDNIISFNSISAIYCRTCDNNRFFRNDFSENIEPIICSYSSNIWDNGIEGNYWSDYNGTDADGDGIGNEPYFIRTLGLYGESYDKDNYPLMEPNIIPEFPSLAPLSILMIIVLVITIFYRYNLHKQNYERRTDP
jgi:parallel beta-helix repeat protein